MPRDGAIIFGGLIGKLDVLRVECSRCGRSGQYKARRADREIRAPREAVHWNDGITADCPRKRAGNTDDPRDLP